MFILNSFNQTERIPHLQMVSWPPSTTSHLLHWHAADVDECLKQAGCEMVRCDSQNGLHVLRETRAPPFFPSLQSGGNRPECQAAHKLNRAIFTTLFSNSVRSPSPGRHVAGSLPQAEGFNPRTALPRGDGKHLASCFGYKASLSQRWCCCRHSRPLSLGVHFPNGALLYCFCKQSFWTCPVMETLPWLANALLSIALQNSEATL